MASGIDSGVDTGNDSSDSSVQEKLSKMDLEKENALEDQDDQNISHNSSESMTEMVFKGEPDTGVSTHHLQPATLSRGYECLPLPPPSAQDRHLNVNVWLNVSRKNLEGVFVSGGPLGTEYKGSELMAKLTSRLRRRGLGLRCLRKDTRLVNYAQQRSTLRLCRATCHNNTEQVREMLEAGVSPNCHDSFKRSPLHLAACMGYTNLVKLLLEHGADPNAKDTIGNTPLHLAACTNNVAVVTLLLRAGTRVSERDLAGHSPLQLAITKFNIMKRSVVPHPVLKDQVCQVISMLTEYMRRKEGATIDPELLGRFESLVRVSDSSEQVESNIRELLSDLSTLSLSSS